MRRDLPSILLVVALAIPFMPMLSFVVKHSGGRDGLPAL